MAKASESKVLQETPLAAFFEFVRSALGTHRVDTSPDTEFYLVNLLSAHVQVQPGALDRALGPELIATARLDPVSRSMRLKQLGDTTLFLAGIFLDYIETRPAATEYYFTIGKTAYGHLADVSRSAGGSLADSGGHVQRAQSSLRRVRARPRCDLRHGAIREERAPDGHLRAVAGNAESSRRLTIGRSRNHRERGRSARSLTRTQGGRRRAQWAARTATTSCLRASTTVNSDHGEVL